jgi:hypothetical protein
LTLNSQNASVTAVLARLGKFFVILALVATVGLHWAALQTVAWTAMLADNLQSASFTDSLVKTFDGKHPCPLCKAIDAGKKSERKNEFTAEMQKFEFPPASESFVLFAPAQFELLPLVDFSADIFAQPPPTPPPRHLLA